MSDPNAAAAASNDSAASDDAAPSYTYPPAARAATAPEPGASLPAPRYGEYAPGYVPNAPQPSAPVVGPPPYGAPGSLQPVRSRRTWDLVLTVILLVMGVFGLGFALLYASLFAAPDLLEETLAQQGFPGAQIEAGAAPAVIAVSHILLYLAALGLSILLLARKRVAFYVPLIAGVVAAAIFWTITIGVFIQVPGIVPAGL